MKMHLKYYLVLFMTILLLGLPSVSVRADEASLWNDDIYHLYADEGILSEADQREENRIVLEVIPEMEFDLATFLIHSKNVDKYGFDTYLDGIYEQNSLGYGVNSDGIILGIDVDHQKFMLRTFGRGQAIFTEEAIGELTDAIRKGYRDNSYIGAQQAYREKVQAMVQAADLRCSQEETTYEGRYSMASTTILSDAPIHAYNAELPEWYYPDAESFVDFHNDPAEPRIIDSADILNDEEEAQLLESIQRIQEKLSMDVVVYTDTTSWGMDNQLYSLDYYTYNGYGCGDTFDGLILFVNMDPDNREMVTSACGNIRGIFTQDNSNALDDILYNSFVDQKYGEGILCWIDRVDMLFTYGSFNPPEWYRLYRDGALTSDYSKNKLVDDLNYFTQEQRETITAKLQELTETYGYDCMVYLAREALNITNTDDRFQRVQDFSDLFYESCGYGIGEDHSGVLFAIYVDEASDVTTQVIAYGSAKDKVSEKSCKTLASIALLNLGEGNYEKNINRYLSYLKPTLKSGHSPITWPIRIFWLILCLLSGLIPASIRLSIAQDKMKVVREATLATGELVEDSFRILSSRDVLLNTRIERVHSPESSSDSSSRSSGSSKSSYSSHSSSSSGRSFSSSRRKF